MNDNKIEDLEAKIEELNARISFNWYMASMAILQLPDKAIDIITEQAEFYLEDIENPDNNLLLKSLIEDRTPIFTARFAEELSNFIDHLRGVRDARK